MDEFIKKADVVKLCENYSEYCFDNCDFLGASDFERLKKDIEGLPTADVVELKHEKWIFSGNEKKCSGCKFIYYSNKDEWNYCPNCGAKMDVSKKEISTEGDAE